MNTLTKKWLTCSFLGLCAAVNAQQITLSGQVSIHNSRYNTGAVEYVPNAYVSAPFAGPDDTDAEGRFYLVFNGIAEGSSVEITVEKAGYEVVNQRDLLDVVIGRKSPLRVFLATKGQLAEAQTELYEVSLKALTRRYEETIAQLRKEGTESRAAIRDLEQRLDRVIADRFEAERLLAEQLEASKRRLPDFARELATVNLDFASAMYQKAYAYVKAGEIEKAIETLDEAVLDQAALDVVENLDSLDRDIANIREAIGLEEERFDESIRLLRLKGKAYAGQADYLPALRIYGEASALLEARDPDAPALAELYWETAALHTASGHPVEALDCKLKSLAIRESLPQTADSFLLNAYLDVAESHASLKRLDEAVSYYRKCRDILKAAPVPDPVILQETSRRMVALLRIRAMELERSGAYADAVNRYESILDFELEKQEIREIQKIIKKLKKLEPP